MKKFIPATTVEKYFAEISAIPRPSEHEQAISDYVVRTAKNLGLRYVRDGLWNVIVWKGGSPGRENDEPVMLQAHMDMVTVCAPGSGHDFLRDPLRLSVDENGNLRAENTTLGADDGYGCAYLLAALTEEFSHPPLECVFTVQEENGCYGAQGLDTTSLASRRMIGLDTMGEEIEYTCCVSCYCSDRLKVTRSGEFSPAEGRQFTLALSGVQPVRTGSLVHPEQGNAIKMMARLLTKLSSPFRLVSMIGGEAENYNPVSCSVLAAFPADSNPEEIRERLTAELRLIDDEVNEGTQNLCLEVRESGPAAKALSAEATERLITLLDLMPSATFEISPKDGSMIATNNVGMIRLDSAGFELVMSDRAKNTGCLDGINRRVRALCDLCGFDLKIENRYMPWIYNPDSPLLKLTAAMMKEQWGHDMRENICPGGLELCDFLPKMPGLDCVMFAPIGGECHSTREWMNLASFNRMYAFLKDLLARI